MSGTRLRVRFAKHGKIRFTSHRDVARIWERALRRAGVSVTYSAGFSPRPKISFGFALPTGFSSDAEYLDVEVDPEWLSRRGFSQPDLQLVEELSASLPAGMQALAVAELAPGELSLQHAVTSCTWSIDAALADAGDVSVVGAAGVVTAGEVAEAVSQALSSEELLVQRCRKGRLSTANIRPAVHSVEVQENINDGVRLRADLATQPQAVRVEEFLASLRPPLRVLRACRLHQWITTDASGCREPLTVPELSVSAAGAAL